MTKNRKDWKGRIEQEGLDRKDWCMKDWTGGRIGQQGLNRKD